MMHCLEPSLYILLRVHSDLIPIHWLVGGPADISSAYRFFTHLQGRAYICQKAIYHICDPFTVPCKESRHRARPALLTQTHGKGRQRMMMAKERNENIVRDTTIMGNFACRVKSKHDIFPLAKFSKHNQAFP